VGSALAYLGKYQEAAKMFVKSGKVGSARRHRLHHHHHHHHLHHHHHHRHRHHHLLHST